MQGLLCQCAKKENRIEQVRFPDPVCARNARKRTKVDINVDEIFEPRNS